MLRRLPYVAGRFYEARPEVLAARVDARLDARAPGPLEAAMAALLPPDAVDSGCGAPVRARLVLVPHAGHTFCGTVIGKTLCRAKLPQRLVLLCPNHTGQGQELAVWPSGAWTTPLGDMPVDEEAAAALLASGGGFTADTAAHLREHSIEVLLPFLQRAVPEARVVPVCVCCPSSRLEPAGLALARVIRKFREQGEEIGIVVSSDMNHYAPHEDTIRRDAPALNAFLAADPVRLYNTVQAEGISMCGVQPAVSALFAASALGETRTALTAYTTSGRTTGDYEAVVGYAGAYLY